MEIFELTYSKPIITRAVRAYWVQQIGLLLPVVTLAMAAFSVYLFVSGDRSWLIGAAFVAVILAVSTIIATYVVNLRRSMTKLNAMGELTATLSVSDEVLRIESGAGASEIPWGSISRSRRYDEFWLVYLESAVFFTIPTMGLAEEEVVSIAAKLEASTVKVA